MARSNVSALSRFSQDEPHRWLDEKRGREAEAVVLGVDGEAAEAREVRLI
jgi:hypothetical protein